MTHIVRSEVILMLEYQVIHVMGLEIKNFFKLIQVCPIFLFNLWIIQFKHLKLDHWVLYQDNMKNIHFLVKWGVTWFKLVINREKLIILFKKQTRLKMVILEWKSIIWGKISKGIKGRRVRSTYVSLIYLIIDINNTL